MNNTVSRRGFTIVELLIVIVVIGILATVVIVAFRGVQQSARDNSVLSDVDALDGIQTSYALRNSGLGGKAWYSGSGSDADINFTPSAGNVIDIVVNNTTKDYCIRVYNPNATKYKYLSTAAQKESNTGVCAANPASAAAVAAAPAAPPASLLAAPTGVTAQSYANSIEISVAWNPVVDAATYKIEYATNPGFTSPQYVTGITGTSRTYLPNPLVGNQLYYVRVYAVTAGNVDGLVSATVTMTNGTTSPE